MTDSKNNFDLIIVGGGINGCGIARDAAGRGLSVCLLEKGDLAGATSSASTKLIHGGLRYLEYYKFRLVREALVEREILWAMAPHIIRPIRFVLPHDKSQRPAWLLRLGLFLYDHLGGRKRLAPTKTLDLRNHQAGESLRGNFITGFEYSDCRVEDARLVILNAMDAAHRGATILPRHRCLDVMSKDGCWHATVEAENSGSRRIITGKVLVNATGPWVSNFLNRRTSLKLDHRIRMVKGSHVVVPKLFDHDRAYIFQNNDGRIVFAIPFEKDFTLIGTTDEDFFGDPNNVAISSAEKIYLCGVASACFKRHVSVSDVVHTFSGVRPLYDDGSSQAQEATRDYVLKVDVTDDEAPMLNIFGGKITTYRRLAESALEKLSPYLTHMARPWTAEKTLPGGDFPLDGLEDLSSSLQRDFGFLDPGLCERLARTYGTRARLLLEGAKGIDDLGLCLGADLYEAEIDYLIKHEWACTAEDVLWRRTKLGLRLSSQQQKNLEQWMSDKIVGQ